MPHWTIPLQQRFDDQRREQRNFNRARENYYRHQRLREDMRERPAEPIQSFSDSCVAKFMFGFLVFILVITAIVAAV